jgi:hypothetical protein
LEKVKAFGNTMNITLSGSESLLAVGDLGQALQEMNPKFDEVTLKVKQAKEIPVPTERFEDE